MTDANASFAGWMRSLHARIASLYESILSAPMRRTMQLLICRLTLADWLSGGAAITCIDAKIRPTNMKRCMREVCSDLREQQEWIIAIGCQACADSWAALRIPQRDFGHMRASKPSRNMNWCQRAARACKPARPNKA